MLRRTVDMARISLLSEAILPAQTPPVERRRVQFRRRPGRRLGPSTARALVVYRVRHYRALRNNGLPLPVDHSVAVVVLPIVAVRLRSRLASARIDRRVGVVAVAARAAVGEAPGKRDAVAEAVRVGIGAGR